MNATEFLDRFSDVPFGQMHTLRRSSRLDEWPTDQASFLAITKQMFPGRPGEGELRQRLVCILCEFLYHDGRTFDSLMYIAEHTYQIREEDEYGDDGFHAFGNGVNALCGILNYLACNGAAPMSNATLVETFKRFASMPALSINATGCLNTILKRQTDSDGDIE